MVLVVDASDVDKTLAQLGEYTPVVIGTIETGQGAPEVVIA